MAGDSIVSISVDVASTLKDMESAAERAENPGPVLLGPITERIRDFIGTIFDSQGEVLGAGWAALSESTLREEGQHLMLEGGDLQRGLVMGDASAGGYATLLDDYTLSVGTSDPVADYMQLGTQRMPARPVVPDGDLPDAVKADIAEALRLWIEEGRL